MNLPQHVLDQIDAAEREGRVTEHGKPRTIPAPSPDGRNEAAAAASEAGAGMATGAPYLLRLPFPPSVNHYWRSVVRNGLLRVWISRDGRTYRKAVCDPLWAGLSPTFKGRLSVRVVAYPPDRRKRDLDNLLKGLLDALQHAGLYHDDSQIDDLSIVRGRVDPAGKGYVLVRLAEVMEVLA